MTFSFCVRGTPPPEQVQWRVWNANTKLEQYTEHNEQVEIIYTKKTKNGVKAVGQPCNVELHDTTGIMLYKYKPDRVRSLRGTA